MESIPLQLDGIGREEQTSVGGWGQKTNHFLTKPTDDSEK